MPIDLLNHLEFANGYRQHCLARVKHWDVTFPSEAPGTILFDPLDDFGLDVLKERHFKWSTSSNIPHVKDWDGPTRVVGMFTVSFMVTTHCLLPSCLFLIAELLWVCARSSRPLHQELLLLEFRGWLPAVDSKAVTVLLQKCLEYGTLYPASPCPRHWQAQSELEPRFQPHVLAHLSTSNTLQGI